MTDDRPMPAEPGTRWTPEQQEAGDGPLGRVALALHPEITGTSTGAGRWPLDYTYVERDDAGNDVYLVELLVHPPPTVDGRPSWTIKVDRMPGHTTLRVAVHS